MLLFHGLNMIYNTLVASGATLSTALVCLNLLLSFLLYKNWVKLNHHAGLLHDKINKLEVTKQQLKRVKKLEEMVEPKKQTPFDVFWNSNLYKLSNKK